MFDTLTVSKYGGVIATLVLSGFGVPIPEEIPIVTAGAMVGHDSHDLAAYERAVANPPPVLPREPGAAVVGGWACVDLDPELVGPSGVTRWWIMLPLCIAGAVISDAIIYAGGRLWGRRLLKSDWVRRRLLPPEKQRKIEANFHKNGILILLGARFTPGVRSPVFLMAGVLKMPLSRFLVADALYAIPGINLLFWLAYVFTDQFVAAVTAVERHRPMAIAVALAAVGGVLLYKLLANRTITTGGMEEIPNVVKPVGAVTAAVEKGVERTIEMSAKAAAAVVEKVTHPLTAKPPGPVETAQAPAPAGPAPAGDHVAGPG